MTSREHLVEILGESLVAVMAGNDPADPRIAQTWDVVHVLRLVDSRNTIRAWFMGMDPIDDSNPAELIADGRGDVALAHARTYLESQ